MEKLTKAEKLVLDLRLAGHTHKEIARKLDIGVSTSRCVASRAYAKSSMAPLTRWRMTPFRQQMVDLYLSGKTVLQVAVAMNLASSTVGGELGKIYSRFGVHKKAELATKMRETRTEQRE